MNYIRRNSGSITTFSITCVILLIVIGVFGYKLASIMGGEGQIQHSCDAGTLNLARTALVTPQVQLNDSALAASAPGGGSYPYEDFFACIGESSPNNTLGIDLLSYNKVAAQALIVANNAQVEGTTAALANAKLVVDAAHELGYALRTRLENNTGLEQAFTSMGQSNLLNMLGDTGSALTFNSMAVSWLSQPGSDGLASTYVDPATVSSTFYSSLPLNTTAAIQPTPSYTPSAPLHFLNGYLAIPLLNGTDSIAFLIDRPSQPTNLVSLTAFETGVTPLTGTNNDLGYLMPNTFQANCQATQNSSSGGASTVPSGNNSQQNQTNNAASGGSSSSNVTLSALACAEIGAVSNGTVASVPAGYIKIQNWPAMPTPDTNVYDAANKDVFDDDAAWPYAIWISPPVNLSVGTTCLFSANLDSLSEWFRWANSSSKKGAYGKDDALDPLTAYGDSITKYGLTGVPSPRIKIASNGKSATVKDLLALCGASNGQNPPNSWSFAASGFSLTSQAQVVDFLAFDQGTGDAQEKSLPGEWDRLVTKVGGETS